jgi:hypothetical protein
VPEQPETYTDTDEKVKYKIGENYPLRRPKQYSEAVVMNQPELKNVLQDKIGFKCDECQLEEEAV